MRQKLCEVPDFKGQWSLAAACCKKGAKCNKMSMLCARISGKQAAAEYTALYELCEKMMIIADFTSSAPRIKWPWDPTLSPLMGPHTSCRPRIKWLLQPAPSPMPPSLMPPSLMSPSLMPPRLLHHLPTSRATTAPSMVFPNNGVLE